MTEAEALQRALAGEHAAAYGYGVLGARLAGSDRLRARAALAAHLGRRDRLSALLRDAGQSPVPAAPAYDLPFPVRTPATARTLATALEERVAAVYADLAAAGNGPVRELAALALQEAAVRAGQWRGSTVPFPGLPERS